MTRYKNYKLGKIYYKVKICRKLSLLYWLLSSRLLRRFFRGSRLFGFSFLGFRLFISRFLSSCWLFGSRFIISRLLSSWLFSCRFLRRLRFLCSRFLSFFRLLSSRFLGFWLFFFSIISKLKTTSSFLARSTSHLESTGSNTFLESCPNMYSSFGSIYLIVCTNILQNCLA